jgi:hypothetical protein
MTDYSCTVDGADLIRSDISVLSVTWGQTIGRHASVAHMHDTRKIYLIVKTNVVVRIKSPCSRYKSSSRREMLAH